MTDRFQSPLGAALACVICGVALVACASDQPSPQSPSTTPAGAAPSASAAPSPSAAQEAAAASAPATYVYSCPDGFRFSARFQDDAAVVTLPARTLTLPRAVSASGARYESGGVMLWTKGAQALLETGTAVHKDCEGARADTPWDVARLLGVEFRALGQEPFWSLDLDEGREIRFTGDLGQTRVVTPAPEPARDAASGTITYTARTEAHELVLVVREAPCQDVMSGHHFPYTVTVRLDGKSFEGCGRTLATNEVLNTYWKLAELGDAPALAGDAPQEAHLRLMAEGSRATGSTGCNRLIGPFQLERDRLRLGPLATTRMACVDPARARQEQEYLRALEATERVAVVDGRLTLYAGERELARFTAMYLR